MKLSLLTLAIVLLSTLSTFINGQVLTKMWYAKYPLISVNPLKSYDEQKGIEFFQKCAALGTAPAYGSIGLNGFVWWITTEVQMLTSDCSEDAFNGFVNGYFAITEFANAKTYLASDCVANSKPVCGDDSARAGCTACNNSIIAGSMVAIVIAAVTVFLF